MLFLDPQIREAISVQTIQVAECFTSSEAGDNLFRDPEPRPARVQNKATVIQLGNGEERISNIMIFTPDAIGLFDRIWLPDIDSTDNELARLPVSVNKVIGETGNVDHYEVAV